MTADLSASTCCFSGYRPEKMPLLGATGAAIPDALYVAPALSRE